VFPVASGKGGLHERRLRSALRQLVEGLGALHRSNPYIDDLQWGDPNGGPFFTLDPLPLDESKELALSILRGCPWRVRARSSRSPCSCPCAKTPSRSWTRELQRVRFVHVV
jgi:hypothetical protein